MPRSLFPESTGVPMGGRPLDAVVIGASTGGPGVIQSILSALPRRFAAPIAVCQHMPLGFTTYWAERLDECCRIKVCEARSGEPFLPGTAYVAPVGRHMRFHMDAAGPSLVLDLDFADSLHVPSIDIMMSSAAQTFGSRGLGVLLTGLGSDGALGLLAMRRAGAHTIVESEASAVAYSMPSSAVELGAALEEAHAEEMAGLITERVSGAI